MCFYWRRVTLSFSYFFHLYIKVTSSPKLTRRGTLKIQANPLKAVALLRWKENWTAVWTYAVEYGSHQPCEDIECMKCAHSSKLRCAGRVQQTLDFEDSVWKDVKRLAKYSYWVRIFVSIICGNNNFLIHWINYIKINFTCFFLLLWLP